MKKLAVIGLAMLTAIGAAPTTAADSDAVSALIGQLDLTSFPNSVGPRRMAGLSTFADYGFTKIERKAGGAVLTWEAEGWIMRFDVLADTAQFVDICFHDEAGEGTYNATSALRISKLRRGLWTAEPVRDGFASCRNNPPQA